MTKLTRFLGAILAVSLSSAYAAAPLCTDNSRDCMIKTASSYLQALISHDPSGVPLASDVNRYENGVNTGTNDVVIRNGLKDDFGFKAIKGIRDVRWLVDGNEALAYYLIDIVIPYTDLQVATTHVTERFKIEGGMIKEIEAIFCTSTAKKPEDSKMHPKKHLSILCGRSLV